MQSLQNIIRPQRISADFLKFIWRPVQRRRCHKASPRCDFRSTKAGRRQIPRGATRKHLEHKVRQHPKQCETSEDSNVSRWLSDSPSLKWAHFEGTYLFDTQNCRCGSFFRLIVSLLKTGFCLGTPSNPNGSIHVHAGKRILEMLRFVGGQEGCWKPLLATDNISPAKVVRTVHFPLGAWPYQYWRSNPSSTSTLWHDKPHAGLGWGTCLTKVCIFGRSIHTPPAYLSHHTNGPTAFPKKQHFSPFTFPRAPKHGISLDPGFAKD